MWGRSFAALGIDYKESTMNLDLCDRAKKYSIGFCLWPIVRAPIPQTRLGVLFSNQTLQLWSEMSYFDYGASPFKRTADISTEL